MHGWSCIKFTIQVKGSLSLMNILINYNTILLTWPLGLGMLLPTILGTLLLLGMRHCLGTALSLLGTGWLLN